MASTIAVISPEPFTAQAMVTVGLVSKLEQTGKTVGVLRPLVVSREDDPVLQAFNGGVAGHAPARAALTYAEYFAAPTSAITTVMNQHRQLAREVDIVVVDGSNFASGTAFDEYDFNARVCANLGAHTVVVLSADQRQRDDVRDCATVALAAARDAHASVAAVVVTRASADESFNDVVEDVPTITVPEVDLLSAPRVSDIARATASTMISGDDAGLAVEAESILLCGMNVEHVLDRMRDGQVIIAAADRKELLIALAAAHAAPGLPSLAGIILNGDFPSSELVTTTVRNLVPDLPIFTTDTDSFTTASRAYAARGPIRVNSARKVSAAIEAIGTSFNAMVEELTGLAPSSVVTPLMFQADLIDKAATVRQRIVLPEPDDDRILLATDEIVRRGIADVILLGDETSVRARAGELGVDLGDSTIISPNDPTYVERYAEEFARLRAKKGVTLEQAREKVQDVSYFGTMMVHMGDADGMVSGAAHTTAHTIVPSFQIIKTKPGTSIVSSVFLMLMADRVYVFGDCAVNLDPSAEQLADIAISSAQTARQFGVEPKVAMISYSTGTSGSGPDVDKVREATELVRAKAPELAVDGPLQFDASVDAAVAAKKMPGSPVAGQATVFIFPDLNTGNTTYKAVQRSSSAVAVGPVLQGLNKPVNDLSRGALVEDIVNTVALTAVQAQGHGEAGSC